MDLGPIIRPINFILILEFLIHIQKLDWFWTKNNTILYKSVTTIILVRFEKVENKIKIFVNIN